MIVIIVLIRPVHYGVSNVSSVTAKTLSLVRCPLVVLRKGLNADLSLVTTRHLGIIHGLVEHGVHQGGVDWSEERHTLLVLLRLASNNIVLVKQDNMYVCTALAHLQDVPEPEGHLADGLLGGELGVAGAGGQDSGHQPYHDPSVHLGEKMNLPEDHISPLGTGGGPVYQ